VWNLHLKRNPKLVTTKLVPWLAECDVSILKHATCQCKVSNLSHSPLFLFTTFKTEYFPYF
jgi:hypothetical protein